jgi:large subunit ribosomal protein L23
VKDPRDVIIRPIVSEKTNEGMAEGKYAFWVAIAANRTEVKQAIEAIFKVKVKKVNTLRQMGKERRMGRFSGFRPERKKAVVTLAEGQRITFFEGLS